MKPQWAKGFRPVLQNLFQKVPNINRHPILNQIRPKPDDDSTGRSSHRHWHQVLARLMVVVATFGAIVSGLTAIAENEAEGLTRQLTQGQHLGLTYRQEQLTDRATREPLQGRLEACINLGQKFLDAENMAGVNERQLSALDLNTQHAQEEFAAARALLPFVNVLKFPFDKKLTPEQTLQKRTAFYLAGLGFETSWPGPEISGAPKKDKDSSKLIWQPLVHKLEAAQESAHGLALVVVLFVSALVLFAIADLWKRWVLYLGILVACGALVCFIDVIRTYGFMSTVALIITQSWPLLVAKILLLGLLIFALIDLLLIIKSPTAAGDEADGEEDGELESELHEAKGYAGAILYIREATRGFSRVIVLLIVIAVFCTALCGYWYSGASSRAAKAAQEAIEDLIEMNCRVSQHNASINSIISGQAKIQEGRARYAARQQWQPPVPAPTGASPDAARAWTEEDGGRDESQNHTWLDDPHFGIDADPQFPQRLKSLPLQYRDSNWYEPFALWDAHSQRSLVWHRQARVFLSILTVLAMAIYLFGQGHSMGHGWASLGLVFCGLVLLAISILLAVCTLAGERQIAETQEEKAAVHYAAAMAKSSMANSSGEFREVIDELEQAVERRPDFALARLALADVSRRNSSSQDGKDFLSFPTQTELQKIVDLKQNALDNLKKCGYAEPPVLLKSLGFNTLLLALQTKSLAQVQKSIAYLQQAYLKGCGDPGIAAEIKWNLGLARLAAGERPRADTGALTAGGIGTDLIVDAFTDLEICSQYYGSLHPGKEFTAVIPDKELLAAVWTEKSVSTDPAPKVSVSIAVSAHAVRWRGQLPEFDPGQDRLFIVWYHLDRDWGVWRAIPGVSGPVDNFQVKRSQGSLEIERSFLAQTGYTRCLPAGSYKAEVYLNGRLTPDPAVTTNSANGFKPVSLSDLNVGLCRPENWRPFDPPKEFKEQGILMRGFQTEEGRPAAFFFTFYLPRSASRPEIINRVKTLLQQAGITGAEVFVPYESQRAAALAEPSATVLYKHWITGEGVQHVGVAFPGAAPVAALCQTLDSLRNKLRAKAVWDAFPYLEARAVSLRFYESGPDIPEAAQRAYRKRFLQSQTRYINWELHLDAAPTSKLVQFAANEIWYGPGGKILNNVTRKFSFPSDWTGSGLTNGLGPVGSGLWRPGAYLLIMKINGNEVARGSFEVVADKAEEGQQQE